MIIRLLTTSDVYIRREITQERRTISASIARCARLVVRLTRLAGVD